MAKELLIASREGTVHVDDGKGEAGQAPPLDKFSLITEERAAVISLPGSGGTTAKATPIHHLPVELLTQIFVYCLPAEEFLDPVPGCMTLVLTRVCKHWRQCMIRTPTIWTSLAVNIAGHEIGTRKYRTNEKSQTALMELWLARSGALPLCVSVSIGLDITATSKCFKVLGSLLRRSCTLKIYTTPIVFRLLSQVKCPALQRFRLSQHWSYCASPEYDKKYYVDMRRMPQFAPNITSLSLCRVSVLTVRELEPVWPRLVELKVREFNPNQDWLQALYLCQNLQSCWLHRGYEPCALSQVTAESPVALPNLQRLFISIGLLRILSASIIFPELQELGIEITIVDKKLPQSISTIFTEMVAKSNCELRSLLITVPLFLGLRTGLLKEMLLVTPSLQQIAVEDRDVKPFFSAREVMQDLTYSGPAGLVPNLRELKLLLQEGSRDLPCDPDVERMLLSRTDGAHEDSVPLEKIYIRVFKWDEQRARRWASSVSGKMEIVYFDEKPWPKLHCSGSELEAFRWKS